MLILTRRVGERLIIADNIEISVLGVKGNQVRIGIEAPDDISVHREEIYQKIQEGKIKDKSNLVDSIMGKIKEIVS